MMRCGLSVETLELTAFSSGFVLTEPDMGKPALAVSAAEPPPWDHLSGSEHRWVSVPGVP